MQVQLGTRLHMTTADSVRSKRTRTEEFTHEGRTWPIPEGMMKIGRGWRVIAPPGHPDAGRTREFKASALGEMGLFLSALDWFYRRPGPGRLLPIGTRLVQVGEMHLEVPKGVKRITNGWRAVCPKGGVEPGRARDFSDVDGEPNLSLQRAIGWHQGIELAPRQTWRSRSPSHSDGGQSRLRVRRKLGTPAKTRRPSGATAKRSKGRPLAWTTADDVRLLVLIANGMPMHDIAGTIGRTYRAVSQHVLRLGRPQHQDAGQVPDPHWTEAEDAFVVRWHSKVSMRVIHKVFFTVNGTEQRSLEALTHRAEALGLVLDREVATRIDQEAQAVAQAAEEDAARRQQLSGISRRMPKPRNASMKPWTSAEDSILRDNQGVMTLRQIHRRFFVSEDGVESRSYAAVAQRIGALGISLNRTAAALLARK